jgi:hypothetical protein
MPYRLLNDVVYKILICLSALKPVLSIAAAVSVAYKAIY